VGGRVELAVDGGDAVSQVGVLVEPEVSGAVLVLEVTDVDLGRVQVGLEALKVDALILLLGSPAAPRSSRSPPNQSGKLGSTAGSGDTRARP